MRLYVSIYYFLVNGYVIVSDRVYLCMYVCMCVCDGVQTHTQIFYLCTHFLVYLNTFFQLSFLLILFFYNFMLLPLIIFSLTI